MLIFMLTHICAHREHVHETFMKLSENKKYFRKDHEYEYEYADIQYTYAKYQ